MHTFKWVVNIGIKSLIGVFGTSSLKWKLDSWKWSIESEKKNKKNDAKKFQLIRHLFGPIFINQSSLKKGKQWIHGPNQLILNFYFNRSFILIPSYKSIQKFKAFGLIIDVTCGWIFREQNMLLHYYFQFQTMFHFKFQFTYEIDAFTKPKRNGNSEGVVVLTHSLWLRHSR